MGRKNIEKINASNVLKKIRLEYEKFGAEGYYRDHSDDYQNPHFSEIKELIERNAPKLDCTNVLDFSAGGGEVSSILLPLQLGKVQGCDPFTFALYEKNTGQPCLRHGFEEIIKGVQIEKYSCIICSFALHLCPEKDLFPLVWNLLEAAPTIVVLTPHKRPELEKLAGIELLWEDFALTERGKKVRIKCYSRIQY